MAGWMVLIQILWVAMALRHRRRDPRDGSVPVAVLDQPWQGIVLPLPRFLYHLAIPGLTWANPTPAWLRPEAGVPPPSNPGEALEGLAVSADTLGGGRSWAKALIIAALLVLALMPPLVMALAAWGVGIGDPDALPDAVAAFGAYVVTVGALLSARLHTRSSIVLTTIYPVSALILAGAWILGAISGGAAGADGPLEPADDGDAARPADPVGSESRAGSHEDPAPVGMPPAND